MSVQVNIAVAKSKLSELVTRAERGERVVLARAGKPRVVLTPITPIEDTRTPFERARNAWAHLAPLSNEENELLLASEPDWYTEEEQRKDDVWYKPCPRS